MFVTFSAILLNMGGGGGRQDGGHTKALWSGFIEIATKILQTNLKYKCKMKSKAQYQDLGLSVDVERAYKLVHISPQMSVL